MENTSPFLGVNSDQMRTFEFKDGQQVTVAVQDLPESTIFQTCMADIKHETLQLLKEKKVMHMQKISEFMTKKMFNCFIKIYSMNMDKPLECGQQIKKEWEKFSNKNLENLTKEDWTQFVDKIKRELINQEYSLTKQEWEQLTGSSTCPHENYKMWNDFTIEQWENLIQKKWGNLTLPQWIECLKKIRNGEEIENENDWLILAEMSWKEVTENWWKELIQLKRENLDVDKWKALTEKIKEKDWSSLPSKQWKNLTPPEWNLLIRKMREYLIEEAINPLLTPVLPSLSRLWFNEMDAQLYKIMKESCFKEVSNAFRKLCFCHPFFTYDTLKEMIEKFISQHKNETLPLLIQEAQEVLKEVDEKTENLKNQNELKSLQKKLTKDIIEQRCEDALTLLQMWRIIGSGFKSHYGETFRYESKKSAHFVITSDDIINKKFCLNKYFPKQHQYTEIFNKKKANDTSVFYGGSIKNCNIEQFPAQVQFFQKYIKQACLDSIYQIMVKTKVHQKEDNTTPIEITLIIPQNLNEVEKIRITIYSNKEKNKEFFKKISHNLWEVTVNASSMEITLKKLEDIDFTTRTFPFIITTFAQLMVKIAAIDIITLSQKTSKICQYDIALQTQDPINNKLVPISKNQLNDLCELTRNSSNEFFICFDGKIVSYVEGEENQNPKNPEFPENLFLTITPLKKLNETLEEIEFSQSRTNYDKESNYQKDRPKIWLANQLGTTQSFLHPKRYAESMNETTTAPLLGRVEHITRLDGTLMKISRGGIHGITPHTLFFIFSRKTSELAAIAKPIQLEGFYSTIQLKGVRDIFSNNKQFLSDYDIYVHHERDSSEMNGSPYLNLTEKIYNIFIKETTRRAKEEKELDVAKIIILSETEEEKKQKKFLKFTTLSEWMNSEMMKRSKQFTYQPNMTIEINSEPRQSLILLLRKNLHKELLGGAITKTLDNRELPSFTHIKGKYSNIVDSHYQVVRLAFMNGKQMQNEITTVTVARFKPNVLEGRSCCTRNITDCFNYNPYDLFTPCPDVADSFSRATTIETNQHKIVQSTFNLIPKKWNGIQPTKLTLNLLPLKDPHNSLKEKLEQFKQHEVQFYNEVKILINNFDKEWKIVEKSFEKTVVKSFEKIGEKIKNINNRQDEAEKILLALNRLYLQPYLTYLTFSEAFNNQNWSLVKKLYPKIQENFEESVEFLANRQQNERNIIQHLFSKVKIFSETAHAIENLKTAFLEKKWDKVLSFYLEIHKIKKEVINSIEKNELMLIENTLFLFEKYEYSEAINQLKNTYISSVDELKMKISLTRETQNVSTNYRLSQWFEILGEIEQIQKKCLEFLKGNEELDQELKTMTRNIGEICEKEKKKLKKEFEVDSLSLKKNWIEAFNNNNQEKLSECKEAIQNHYSSMPELFSSLYLDQFAKSGLEKKLNTYDKKRDWENFVNVFKEIMKKYKELPTHNIELFEEMEENYNFALSELK